MGEVACGEDLDTVDGGADGFESACAAVLSGGVGASAGLGEGLGGGHSLGVGGVTDGQPGRVVAGGVGGGDRGGGREVVDVALLVGYGAL